MKSITDLPKRVQKSKAILLLYSQSIESSRIELYAAGIIDQIPPQQFFENEPFSIYVKLSQYENPQMALNHLKDREVVFYFEYDNEEEIQHLKFRYG